jgi:N-acyl-phosphatidylethanolamine-hydrolysing phospholipase D
LSCVYKVAGLLASFIVVYLVSLSACTVTSQRSDPSTPAHHTDDGFRNLYIEPLRIGFFGFLRLRYFGDEQWADYAATADRVPKVKTPLDRINAPGQRPQVTWIGHDTVLVQYRGVNVLTDPVFSQRSSPFSFLGPRRSAPPSLRIDQLPRIDFVLISHNHYDHLDAYTVRALGDRTIWVVPLGYKQWFAERGVARVEEFDWWDSREIAGATITATPSQHWTGRGVNDRYRALWASWAVQIGGFKFWFGGDTGYNDKIFVEIGARHGPFELALIPIGGYEPRWFMKNMHVNPEEAVLIHKDIGSKYSLGIHWGTFPLTAEPIDEPPQRLRAAAASIRDSVFVTYPLGGTESVPFP